MRTVGGALLVGLIGLAVWLWGFGGADVVTRWAAAGQRDIQNAMAGYLRALKRGDSAAFISLMGLCFAYGFFHAAGPGHGKMVIGGYGVAARVTAIRLSLLALVSSLAQSLSAVVLVALGVFFLGWGRERMSQVADQWLAPLSMVAIALVGIWLVWRGFKAIKAAKRREACHHCGHVHGPSVEQVEHANSLRDSLVLIGAIALRPCTGALFLLIITWSMGIFAAGIAGTIVMGLGTASITILVAIAAVTARGSFLLRFSDNQSLAFAAGVLQMLAGFVITLLATQMGLAAI